ncbi:cysteine desulfurase family protein [Geothrix sp. PMB-07]|uniref:cysteine desulfurase family protein n=1 Tax=Geothrix sp. PMB-07 TaxID=3068640 RepID=UPI002740C329|nr:aminotransferase class V-fold PLP-dependent enzyme [Geothrix sp. PMB-07]WLT33197.1 aminotransferase class V-fold PLP-dependent enzyme [Geothrix sp. PMB-07]
MPRFYFDANASAPPHPEAVEAVRRAMAEDWANPTSTHRDGQRARFRLEEARRELAASLGVAPGELVFCASASEALHLLLRGLQSALGDRPAAVFPGEHSACLNPLRDWARVAWLPELPAECGTVVQMAANNETGILYAMPTVLDAARIKAGELVRIKDCCQAWGKVPVDLSDCDAAVFSGHKMGGPRGAALLWMKPGLPWEAVMEGPQERRRRGGTEDLPAILGLAAAARHLPERLAMNAALVPLRDHFEAEILSWGRGMEIIGGDSPRLPNTSCLLFRGRNGEGLHASLDLAGFAVSTGSACHSGSVKPSHAITALGYSMDEARSVLRFSMLPETRADEVESLLTALKRLV